MKINSFVDLKNFKKKYSSEKYDASQNKDVVLIKVGMATCGIASGARQIMKFIVEECEQQAVDVKVKQTGCLGYCYAEPMIEVLLPGKKSKVFGYVDKSKAREIIEKYIMQGEHVEGEIALSFNTIND